MPNVTLQARLALKCDTTQMWQTHNPVLNKGELGLERMETGEILAKAGDGVKTWTE